MDLFHFYSEYFASDLGWCDKDFSFGSALELRLHSSWNCFVFFDMPGRSSQLWFKGGLQIRHGLREEEITIYFIQLGQLRIETAMAIRQKEQQIDTKNEEDGSYKNLEDV